MTTLVFGGSGLVGTALRASDFDELGSVVWVSRADFDLSRPLNYHNLPVDVDRIVYLAQGRHFREFPQCAGDTFAVNVASPLGLIEHFASRGLKQFVYASTGNVHWSGLWRPREQDPHEMRLVDFYSATKIAAEELLAPWSADVSLAVLRLFTVYSQEMQTQGLVDQLRERLETGRPIDLRGARGDIFQPTHANDVARAITVVLRQDWKGCADVAGPEELTVAEMVQRLAARRGDSGSFRHVNGLARRLVSHGVQLSDELPEWTPEIRFPGNEC